MDAFLPPGVPPGTALFLVAISAVTSAVSGAFGLGGGVALIAIMAPILPVEVLIPVHGLVQLGSNVSRASLLARHAALGPIGWFLSGAVVGAAVGAAVVTDLPDSLLKILIGLFVIWSVAGRMPTIAGRGRGPLVLLGAGTTVLAMFIGSTGPLVVAIFRQLGLDRERLVATHAVAMVFQHALKVLAFSALGFAFAAWLPLVAAMIASGFLGTYAGTRLLKRLPTAVFRRAVAIILLALGARLVIGEALVLLGVWT